MTERLLAFFALCGPVALARAARRHGSRLSVLTLMRECGTDRRGTTLLALKRAAEKYGFVVNLFRANYAALEVFPKPLIVHMQIGHFEVIEACDGHEVQMAGLRPRRIDRENFERGWSRVVMALARPHQSREERIVQ